GAPLPRNSTSAMSPAACTLAFAVPSLLSEPFQRMRTTSGQREGRAQSLRVPPGNRDPAVRAGQLRNLAEHERMLHTECAREVAAVRDSHVNGHDDAGC